MKIENLKGIAEEILRRVDKGFDAQVDISAGRTTSIRFGDNAITQNAVGERTEITLEVAREGRRGTASTNKEDAADLEKLVASAEAIATQSPVDPEHMPPLEPCEYIETPQRYFTETAELSPQTIVDHISIVVGMAKSRGFRASGLYQVGAKHQVIANSRGLRAEDSFTHIEYSCSIAGESGSGYANTTAESIDSIDPETLARRAFGTAVAAQNPRKIDPGDYNVVLAPQAVMDLLEYFTYFLSRRDADEGTNAFAGKLGERIFSELIDISVGLPDPTMPPPPFGDEALPVRPTSWVRAGRLERLPMTRFWAKERGDSPDAIKWPFTISGGDATIEQLAAVCGKGLLVQRFWYIEEVDAREMLLTGMTRDGVFEIENGEIARPVRNLRFNESPMVALANVLALGKPIRVGSYASEVPYWAKVPAMAIRDFTFSSNTDSV